MQTQNGKYWRCSGQKWNCFISNCYKVLWFKEHWWPQIVQEILQGRNIQSRLSPYLLSPEVVEYYCWGLDSSLPVPIILWSVIDKKIFNVLPRPPLPVFKPHHRSPWLLCGPSHRPMMLCSPRQGTSSWTHLTKGEEIAIRWDSSLKTFTNLIIQIIQSYRPVEQGRGLVNTINFYI